MPRPLLPALLAPLLLAGCSVFGAKAAEEPAYDVLVADGAFEVRRYREQVIARTTVEADAYGDASGATFDRLAGYIFGNNRSRPAADSEPAAAGGDGESEKIAMTAPVLMERKEPRPSEEIAMTAPVLMEDTGESWEMAFYLPDGYTVETAPEPLDPRVEIATVPARTVAVVTFPGRLRPELIDRQTAEIESWLERSGYRAVSPPRTAGYNPPWTLPALRRNEIQVDVEPR